jgi:hypothetical protein
MIGSLTVLCCSLLQLQPFVGHGHSWVMVQPFFFGFEVSPQKYPSEGIATAQQVRSSEAEEF